MKINGFTSLKGIIAMTALFVFAISSTAVAQSSGEKNKVFEFFLTQKISTEEAKKIDATMISRKGILSSSTDATTGKVTVKVIPMIDFWALQTVVNYAGFECNQENMVIREE